MATGNSNQNVNDARQDEIEELVDQFLEEDAQSQLNARFEAENRIIDDVLNQINEIQHNEDALSVNDDNNDNNDNNNNNAEGENQQEEPPKEEPPKEEPPKEENIINNDGNHQENNIENDFVEEHPEIPNLNVTEEIRNQEQQNQEEPLKEEPKKEDELQSAIDAINSSVNLTMFMNKLNTFNSMFKTDIDANKFIDSLTGAWELLQSNNRDKRTDGYVMLGDAFRETLKNAFSVEEEQAYKEHRLPEYNEIIVSANELLRVGMFTFTDLYSNNSHKHLFKSTICGSLTAKDMAALTGKSDLWGMDQKSDKAWEIQSADAKAIANQWLESGDKPFDKLIEEMNALIELGKNGIAERNNKDIYNKLAAAEWILVNNEQMMTENPNDPLNKMPDWGNKYWKATIQARDALGIPKHISMRELIQGDYAESSKAVTNKNYNEKQIEEHVLDPEVRSMVDSMEVQASEFTIQRESIKTHHPGNEERVNNIDDPDADRIKYYVYEVDEIRLMKEAPIGKDFILEDDLNKQVSMNKDYIGDDFK